MTAAYGRYPAFPFRMGEDGRTACVADPVQHVTEEVVQLILTAVGERLFQPDIGTNVRRLVFESLDEVDGRHHQIDDQPGALTLAGRPGSSSRTWSSRRWNRR